MFSGIVEEMGIVQAIENTPQWTQLTIQAKETLKDTRIGDSIAVNGICLTVIDLNHSSFVFQAIPETLAKTNINYLKINSPVNLERSITATTRIGGHMVQGHVDTVCRLISINNDENGTVITFELPESMRLLVIDKGYVAIDGMSLTVINRQNHCFSIAFIPHTIQVSIVQYYQVGQLVNLETDIIGKYVQQYLNLSDHHAKN